MRLLLLFIISGCFSPIMAMEFVPQGQAQEVIRTPHLRVIVPKGSSEQLKTLAQKADLIFARMAEDAAYEIKAPLWVLMSDVADRHNGFSMVIPNALVQVELRSASPETSINEYHQALSTLIHEFAHHITNDRDHGFRKVLRQIFGRVMPEDLLSIMLFYLSTPSHQTMPDFWDEGLAMWAESTYLLDDGIQGRAFDPITWARWRIAVANDRIPEIGEWRYITHRYPYGRNAYDWGLMYVRYLVSQGYNPWTMAQEQSKRWAFSFNKGIRKHTGKTHAILISEALESLTNEMTIQLESLKSGGAIEPKALLKDGLYRLPAWLDNKHLIVTHADAYNRPRLAEIQLSKSVLTRNGPGLLSNLRRVQEGKHQRPWLLYQTTQKASPFEQIKTWLGRTYASLALFDEDMKAHHIDGHFLAGDARWIDHETIALVAIERLELGAQQLVTGTIIPEKSLSLAGKHIIPTEDRPWFPSWRPQFDKQLAWVEQYEAGYRLVFATFSEQIQRTVVWDSENRLVYPVWSADGQTLYITSDESGVSNAYAITFSDEGIPERPIPVTNVLGAVRAAVPSPNNKQLALLVERSEGLNLAIIDASQRTDKSPITNTPWQAPQADLQERRLTLKGIEDVPTEIGAYNGLTEIRPLYWTPTTVPVPEGGFGAAGVFADPLHIHTIRAGAGVGTAGGPVGRVDYTWNGWLLSLGGAAWQTEQAYENLSLGGIEYERSDTIYGGEVRIGRGFADGHFDDHLYVAAGSEKIRGDYRQPGTTGEIRLRPRSSEYYVELHAGKAIGFNLPDGYGSGTGLAFQGVYRHSGFGGDVEGGSALGALRLSMDVIPELGQQAVLMTSLGWHDGTSSLRRSIPVGGNSAFLPRGYDNVMRRGRYFNGASFAWRTPLWRPFTSWGTSAAVHRQLILETFIDTGSVSDKGFFQDLSDNDKWYTSAGLAIHSSWLIWRVTLNPGIGAAYRFNDDSARAWLTLGFPW
jgi:hypothetical protein